MLIIILIFILGLSVGSAINALVWRLNKGKSWIKGGSICPYCKHKLAWFDLVPILSFILLKGECRYCHKKISWQYPLVELTTGVIFILIYLSNINFELATKLSQLKAGPPLAEIINYQLLIINYFIATILIIIFVYDLKHYLILDKVVLPAIVIVFLFNLLLGKSWLGMIASALAISGFFLAQLLLSRGRWIGGGDLRLGFFMGVVLGWPNIAVALFLAYILGAVIGTLLVALKIKKWHSKIPFAAFLCPATFVAMLWGEELIRWYFKIL